MRTDRSSSETLKSMLKRPERLAITFAALAASAQAFAQTDPLPSWNDGPTRKVIVGHWKRLRDAAARAGDGAPDYYRAAPAP
jgi:hypothetical protein